MKNEKEDIIYIIDIIGYLAKRFLLIALCGFIGLTIALVTHYLSSNSAKSIEQFNYDLAEYEFKINSLKNERDNTILHKSIIEKQKQEDPIVLMNDGRDIDVSTIILSVTISESEKNKTESFEKSYNQITSTIKLFLSSIDYAGIINSSFSNQYLNRLVEFEGSDGLYSILVFSDNDLIPSSFAESISSLVKEFVDSRIEMELIGFEMKTNQYTGLKIYGVASGYDDEIITLEKKNNELTKTIMELEKNKISKYHFARHAVIGFVVGVFLSAIVLIFVFLQRNPITSSFKIENKSEMPFIGALFADKCIFDVVARRIIGERKNKDSMEERSYLEKSFRKELGSACKVAVLSTSSKKAVLKASDPIHSMLEKLGYESTFVFDSANNPETLNVIQESEIVVFIERQWVAKWILFEYNYNLCGRFEKPIAGFILC